MTRVPVSRAVFAQVARCLEAGGVRVVFVGGATVPLRVDIVAGGGRVTDDLDCIVDAVSYAEYTALLQRLRALGFTDAPEEGVTCRMRLGETLVDFMPRANLPVAPSSPSFERIWADPDTLEVEPGLEISVAPSGRWSNSSPRADHPDGFARGFPRSGNRGTMSAGQHLPPDLRRPQRGTVPACRRRRPGRDPHGTDRNERDARPHAGAYRSRSVRTQRGLAKASRHASSTRAIGRRPTESRCSGRNAAR